MKKVTRLFQQFHPDNYQIDLVPNRDDMTFTGTVVISGQKAGRPSQRLTLHQSGLKIDAAEIVRHDKTGDKTMPVDRINPHAKFEEVRLHSKDMLFPGRYTITLKYKGKITTNMEGIYPCNFTVKGQKKQLIATQFESHFARQVFPSIDEPEAKATFDLSLSTPKNETVVSNTPAIKTEDVPGQAKLIKTTFATTPKMSTYLLAFVYGELEYLEAKSKTGVVVRTYATADNVKHTKFALDVAVNCLDYYSDYFDMPYPLPKYDLIALPDFASGAMENWGCTTYREQAIIVDSSNTSLSMKQYVAMVVAHEMTHQWFGNLVTMKWWTDLWLNEGFASWFEYLALDHLFPEWQMWTQFIVDDQLQALKADALEHTHPVEVEVNHPDEIRTIFDNISYHKGASVIHMLYAYIGATDFQMGLRYYIKEHAYKNTVTNDLWQAFAKAANKPVAEFMQTWTGQSGYPLITVDSTDSGVIISQERFVLNPLSKHKLGQVWPVPLLSTDKSLPASLDQVKVSLPAANHPDFRLNDDASGFYRTIYNVSHTKAIAQQITKGQLDPLDRLSLLADSAEAAKAGKLSTIDTLHLLEFYDHEDDNAVWDVIAGVIGAVRHVIHEEDIRDSMKPFIRRLVSKQLKRLGWHPKANEPYFDSLLRPTILSLASLAEEPSVVAKINEYFAKVTVGKDKIVNPIPPDLRALVYGTIARNGDKKDYDKMIAMHNTTSSNEEKLNLCAAITSFKQPELTTKTLEFIQTDKVRLQDLSYWMAYSLANHEAHAQTWQWLKTHWQWLDKSIGGDLAFYRTPLYVARGSSNSQFIKDYQAFFASVMQPALKRSVDQGTEIIQWQSAWRDRDLESVRSFFKHRQE